MVWGWVRDRKLDNIKLSSQLFIHFGHKSGTIHKKIEYEYEYFKSDLPEKCVQSLVQQHILASWYILVWIPSSAWTLYTLVSVEK